MWHRHSKLLIVVSLLWAGTLACARTPARPPETQAQRPLTVFFGTYTRGWACPPPADKGAPCSSKGIYRASFDPRTGALGEPVLAAPSDNPSYLTISADGKYLYAVNEVGDFQGQKSGAVSAFAIDDAGGLRLLNQLPSHGADPCHLSLTRDGTTLLVANYSGGNVSSYRVAADGVLGEGNTVANPGAHGPHPNQEAAHAHFIAEASVPGLVYVADLGLDRVFLYDVDPATSKLSPHAAQPSVALPPGAGPRHIGFHPSKRFLYTNNELATAASVFSRDPTTGQLTEPPLQTLSTIPLPYGSRSNNAALAITSDGRFAYVSNRGHDSIATFAIDRNSGKLTLLGVVASGGKEPRDFQIAPGERFLLVSNQISDQVVVFRMDQSTGQLERTPHAATLSRPVNVAFWPPLPSR